MQTTKSMPALTAAQRTILDFCRSGYQLVYVKTLEELRLTRQIAELAEKLLDPQTFEDPVNQGRPPALVARESLPVISWSPVSGFVNRSLETWLRGDAQFQECFGLNESEFASQPLENTALPEESKTCRGPDVALSKIAAGKVCKGTADGIYILYDFDRFLMEANGTRPTGLERMLWELINENRLNASNVIRSVIVVSPTCNLSPRLRRAVGYVEPALPNLHDMQKEIADTLSATSATEYETPDLAHAFPKALLGLTQLEAANVCAVAAQRSQRNGRVFVTPQTISVVQDLKAELLAGSGVLTYVPQERLPAIEDIGGFGALKRSLYEWKAAMGPDAEKLAIPRPRGFALLGVPGTGKTATGQAAARVFNLPLYVVDVGAAMTKFIGDSEGKIRDALSQIDSQQGAVVLFDEVDKALSGAHDASGDSGVSSRILGYILSWMSTQTSGAFSILTMNRIDRLAVETFRAGRVNAIFRTSLPNEARRKEIFEIHMRKLGITPEYTQDEWRDLTERSKNLTGAEISAMVQTALFVSLAGRDLRTLPSLPRPTMVDFISARSRITPVVEMDATQLAKMAEGCPGAIDVEDADPLPVPGSDVVRKSRRLGAGSNHAN